MKASTILKTFSLAALLALGATSANADQIVLDASKQCSAGNEAGNIDETDVTGNAGGSNDCWGLFGQDAGEKGNDPGPGGSFSIDGMVYNFLTKTDVADGGGQSTDGANIGFNLGGDVDGDCEIGSGLAASSGCWEITSASFNPAEFLIVLKAGNSPGYGIWLFDGAAAASRSGTWEINWKNNDIDGCCANVSHISIYVKGEGFKVPEPATIALLGLGLVGAGLARRRRQT